MKTYNKLVYDLKTGDIVEESFFEYDGIIAECKGGGGSTTNTQDPEYNKRMAAIAEAQQAMAEEYFQYWKTDFKPFEREQIAAQRELLPGQTALAERGMGLAGQYFDEVTKGVSAEEEMGMAKADVRQAYAGMEGEMRRSAGRMGISPESGRYAGMRSRMLLDKAKGLAGAGTMARRYAEREQFERLRGAMQ
jgi:hypothetical protein